MTILGIDPGTTRVGYGIITGEGNTNRLVTAGILKVPENSDKLSGLQAIRKEMCLLCEKHNPSLVAVEKLFFAKNRKTGLAVAEARGVILVTIKELGIDLQEYSPNEVKLSVAGYGGADKKSILKMVRLILGVPNLKVIDDASDALAIALAAKQNLVTKIGRGSSSK